MRSTTFLTLFVRTPQENAQSEEYSFVPNGNDIVPLA